MDTKPKLQTQESKYPTKEQLEALRSQLMEWLDECRYAHYKANDCSYLDCKKGRVHIVLYTDTNSYNISARPPKTRSDNDEGYLGCISITRKPRAGEDWHRGNDLADGPFCHKTWVDILGDIVGYELVKIQRPLKYKYEPELEQRYIEEQ